MPPASLPAWAAIRPGPSRPRKAKTRARRGLSRAGRRGRPRVADRIRRMTGGTRTAIELSAGSLHCAAVYSVGIRGTGRLLSILAEQAEAPTPASWDHRLEHVIDGNHAKHPGVLVTDGDRREVVVGHQAGNLLEGRVRCETWSLVLDDLGQLARCVDSQQCCHGHAPLQRTLGGADEHRAQKLGCNLAGAYRVERIASG